MSDWLALLLTIVATCAVVVLIAVLRQRRAGDGDDPSQTPDVIEYMTMMLGVVYAIVLGLALAGVWEERGAADEWLRREAQGLYEIHQRAEVLPGPVRDDVQGAVEAYAGHTVTEEWSHMLAHDELTDRGDDLLADLREAVTRYEPETVREVDAYQGMAAQAAAVAEARNGRGGSAEHTMPLMVWIGMITGAVAVVGMLFILQIQRSPRELVLAGLFSALIAFLLFLVWQFDDPYGRGLDDPRGAYTEYFPQAAGQPS